MRVVVLTFEPLPTLSFAAVVLGWLAFCAVFALRPNAPLRTDTRKQDRSSRPGIVLQGASYALVWMGWRHPFTPILRVHWLLDVALTVLTVALLEASVWIVAAAVRSLGKQWSLTARVLEGHSLIIEGPYRLVRHPIYTGMFGMLLATGLAVSRWFIVPIAALVFWIGTAIRIRSEEALLREAFPAEYDAYARRVPAVIPWPF